jgi:ABC-2 family transporter protein
MSKVVFLETIRRHVTNVGFLVILLLLASIGALHSAVPGFPAPYGIMSIVAMILAAQLIGPEFSSGTLQLILSKPVNRSSYLLARAAGVFAALMILMWSAAAAQIGVQLLRGSAGQWRDALVPAVTNSVAEMMTIALLALLGAMTRAYFNVALYFLLTIGLTIFGFALKSIRAIARGSLADLGLYLREHPAIISTLERVYANLFPSAPATITLIFVIRVASNAAIALLGACILFRRREVPYGAD